MHRRTIAVVAVVAAMSFGGAGAIAATNGSGGAGQANAAGSRLDDGKDLLPQAKITEEQATKAAQAAVSGPLNETDLEHYNGRLVFNVDVGSKDVKVDASTGSVVATPADD